MSDWTLADAVRRDELSGDWECGCDMGGPAFMVDWGVCSRCKHPLSESVGSSGRWRCTRRVSAHSTADQRDRRELLALVREMAERERALLNRLSDVYWPDSQDPFEWAGLLDRLWQENMRIQYGLRGEAI